MFTIDLSSLTEDGEEFLLKRGSDEVHGLFAETLGTENPFTIVLKIIPQANFFSLTGSIKAEYDEDCSRCGHGVKLSFATSMHEMLLMDKDRPRKYQSTHHHETSSEGIEELSVTYLESVVFDVGAYLNEVIVMAMDDYPKCIDTKNCDSQMHVLEKAPEPTEEEGNALFKALQGIKTRPS